MGWHVMIPGSKRSLSTCNFLRIQTHPYRVGFMVEQVPSPGHGICRGNHFQNGHTWILRDCSMPFPQIKIKRITELRSLGAETVYLGRQTIYCNHLTITLTRPGRNPAQPGGRQCQRPILGWASHTSASALTFLPKFLETLQS